MDIVLRPLTQASVFPEDQIKKLIQQLEETHPDAQCELIYNSPFELLIATILSAQTTDKKVNQITPKLFAQYPTPAAMAAAPRQKLELILKPLGFFRRKAKYLHTISVQLVKEYGGEVPSSMLVLTRLPGVARKTANVVLSEVFGKSEGIAVDTHVSRVARRLGLSSAETTGSIEKALMKIVPQEQWSQISHLLIFHGRRVCRVRKPLCGICTLNKVCSSAET